MRILVIRLSSMGDVLLSTPVLRSLSETLEAKVDFLTYRKYFQIVRDNPYIHKIFSNTEDSLAKLQCVQYDYVIDLQNSMKSQFLRRRVKSKNLCLSKDIVNKWLLYFFNINRYTGYHVVDKYYEAIKPLEVFNTFHGLDYYPDTENYKTYKSSDRKLITICLGGSYVTKRIPIDLVRPLFKLRAYDFILLGGADVESVSDCPQNVTDLIGKTDINTSGCIIQESDVVLTGDTGMMHIAAALDKPMIVIWGSTDESIGFSPYYKENSNADFISLKNEWISCRPCSKYGRNSCPKKHMNCLNGLDSDSLRKHLLKLLL